MVGLLQLDAVPLDDALLVDNERRTDPSDELWSPSWALSELAKQP